jgi:hypothetical protein
MGDNFSFLDPTTWWGDSSPVDSGPVAPTDTTSTDTSSTSNYGYSTNTGVYPDPNSPTGYSDINGNQVDSTGQPVNYDSNGNLVDSNGNIIQKATPYQPSPQDSTTVSNPDGSTTTTYSNGQQFTTPPLSQQQAIAQQTGGVQQPGQPGQQRQGGLMNTLFGGGNQQDTSGGSSGLLGTLGMLAAGAGAGYLLSNMLGNKSSTGTASVTPAHAATIAPSNLQYTQLAAPGVNPGYAMGQPVAPAQPLSNNLLVTAPPVTQTINPQTLMRQG